MSDRVGQQFGNYRLTRLLGQGGFADVYLAEHVQLGTQAAVKVLSIRLTSDNIELSRAEARIVANLRHPRIVRLLEFDVKDNTPFLVMEYAPKGSLRELHPKGTLVPLPTVVSYVKQVAEALQYIHEQKLVHRDIKPHNLLLRPGGEVLLTDFGIAVVSHSTLSESKQDDGGTPEYMAPEQFEGISRPASDQYSLGIVVYEWLCGRPPFRHNGLPGDRKEVLRHQHLHVPPPSMSAIVPTISPEIERVVLRSLEKDRHKRFATVKEFADALEQAFKEEITALRNKPLTVALLSQEYIQQALLDLIVADKPDWWNDSGQKKIRTLRLQAEKEARTDIMAVFSTLAERAASRVGATIESDNWKGAGNLLDLIDNAAPPSTDPKVWNSLLDDLSRNPQALKAVLGNWKLCSWLLRQWGSISSSVDSKLIRLWFPATWPELWRFLALRLPEEWYNIVIRDLLQATSDAPLLSSIVRGIELEDHSLIKDYLSRSFHSIDQLRVAVRLFAKLAESGYARKMDLLRILLTSARKQDRWNYWNIANKVFTVARLTKEEIVEVLEIMHSSAYASYCQIPSVLGYVEQYLLALSPNDLDRSSARRLVRFMSDSSSVPLSQEIRPLAQNWAIISAFIDQPVINKKELLALANAINQLPPTTHATLIDKLSTSFIYCVHSEIDLICVIQAMNTFLTKPDLLRFLHRLAEAVGEKYLQNSSEVLLAPYIQIALQVEKVVGISNTEGEQFVAQFLDTLLKHASRKTYKRLNTIVKNWPAEVLDRWHDQEHLRRDGSSHTVRVKKTPLLPLGVEAPRREHAPDYRPPARGPLENEPESAHQGISRRTIVLGLGVAGLVIAGGGLTWLVFPRLFPPPSSPGPTPTPAPALTPTPTPTPTPIHIPLGMLLYTYRRHSDYVWSVAWSSDGQRIASASADHTVQVWDAAGGGHAYTYRGHSDVVYVVAWSPDGQHIASGSFDKTVQVWDAADGGHAYTYRGHSDAVQAVPWSLDGRCIASGSHDKTVQVWDAAGGGPVFTYRGHVFTYRGHHDGVYAVAWSPDGRRIASGGHDNKVQVWDAADGGHRYTYPGHSTNAVQAVAWSPDGRRIASGSDDKTVQVWDAADGGHVYTYRGHHDGVLAVAWSPDGRRIASGSSDGTVQVWDAADGGHRYTYPGHSNSVTAVAWSPDGRRIASGSWDQTVQVWGAG